ncbi:MAG: RidA family protein [Acidobacteriota bacterium]|nr:RidA family protein [Acidobacteriota bacterium]
MRRFPFGARCAGLALVVALGATAAAQSLQRINPPGLSTPSTYSHIVRAGKTLYIAGQVGADAEGTVAGPGMAEQLEQALKNLQTALTSQGADFSHVAKITVYTTDVEAFRAPEAAAVRAKYFGQHRPASTLVGVMRLASLDYKVEIEATAVLP